MVATELLVLKYAEVGFVADFVEVIHVELPHEGGEVAVPEIDGQHLLLELLDVLDDEGSAILVPTSDVGELVILNRNGGT